MRFAIGSSMLITALLLFSSIPEAGAKDVHGPTTIVIRHADGTHTISHVDKQTSTQDQWGNRYMYRDLMVWKTQQHPAQ